MRKRTGFNIIYGYNRNHQQRNAKPEKAMKTNLTPKQKQTLEAMRKYGSLSVSGCDQFNARTFEALEKKGLVKSTWLGNGWRKFDLA
jgi:hypothetical protein